MHSLQVCFPITLKPSHGQSLFQTGVVSLLLLHRDSGMISTVIYVFKSELETPFFQLISGTVVGGQVVVVLFYNTMIVGIKFFNYIFL